MDELLASPDSTLIALAAGLAASVYAVGTAARGAFPGWAGGRARRWQRGVALVTLTTYSLLVLVMLLMLAGVQSGDSRPVVWPAIAAVVTVVVLELLALGKLATHEHDEQPPFTALLMACCISPWSAGAVFMTGFRPINVMITWLAMVALYVGWEALQSRISAWAALTIYKRRSQAREDSLSAFGGLVVAENSIVLQNSEQHVPIARTAEIIGADGTVQLISPLEAGAIAKSLQRHLTSTPSKEVAWVTCATSWLHSGTTFTIYGPNGKRTAYREQRGARLPGQIQGFPVGAIPVPTAELERLGLKVLLNP